VRTARNSFSSTGIASVAKFRAQYSGRALECREMPKYLCFFPNLSQTPLSGIFLRSRTEERSRNLFRSWPRVFLMKTILYGQRRPQRRRRPGRRFRRRRTSRERTRLRSFVLWMAIHRAAKADASCRVIPSSFCIVLRFRHEGLQPCTVPSLLPLSLSLSFLVALYD